MLSFQKELEIIMFLRRNARETLTKISTETGLPVSTIYDRVRFNKAGLVDKNVSLLNFNKIGYDCHLNIILKVGKEDRETIKEFLLNHQSTNTLYLINNGYDYSTESVFKNQKDAEEFIEHINDKFKIKEIRTYHIIDELCKETFLSQPAHIAFVTAK
jgi:DNA-binding Lrp family transcriptional regulator